VTSLPYDRERLSVLITGHLEQALSEEEQRELESILSLHEAARRQLVLAASVHDELFAVHEQPALIPAEASGLPERRAPTLRTLRHSASASSPQSWTPAAVAAALLFGALLLTVVSAPEQRTSTAGRRATPRGTPGDALPAPAVADSAGAAPAAFEEERLRAETASRLAELDRRRSQIEQSAPRDATPERVQKRETDLVALAEERRRIEDDMRAAIEQARRSRPERRGDATTAEPAAPPPPAATSAFASAERVDGDGWIVRKDSRTRLVAGAEILPGDGVETGIAASRVVLRFADRTKVELRGDSLIAEVSGGAPSKHIHLARGALAAEVSKQPAGHSMTFRTPHSESVSGGTSLRLQVEPGDKGATRIDVHEGRVGFTRLLEKKSTVDVTAGHYAVAAPGMPLLSRPLPPVRTGTPERPAVAALIIVNADTGRPLLQFDPLEDGAVISLAELPTRNLNIQASTSPATVGSVQFSWDGMPAMEGRAPYFLTGNDPKGKPLAWTPAPGEHTLTVLPYSGPPASNRREGTGTAGTGFTVRLRVR